MLTETFLSFKIAQSATSVGNKKVEKYENTYRHWSDEYRDYLGISSVGLFITIMVISWILFLFVTVMPKVLLATGCNPKNKVGYGILAFFFGEIYLLQWSIRKFLMNEPGYCKV